MPIATPFHPRTSAHCVSLFYKDWAGYYAVRSYDTSHDREYFAFRHACGLIDVTPLYKYDVRGEDAARFLARVMVRDIRKLKVGQVYYVCWCDDHGRIIENTDVKSLLATLDIETFVLDLRESITAAPRVEGIEIRLADARTLEASLPKAKSLNSLFAALDREGIHVLSMRNKANRLEELFLGMVEKGAERKKVS